MKKGAIFAGVFLLIVSLFVAGRSFTTPTEISVKKPVVMLNYKQEGQFSYVVSARPASFYGDTPAPAPKDSPQIPAKFIENMDFTFRYRSDRVTNLSFEINAILESPGTWEKTVNLVPRAIGAGNLDISIPLSLQSFQDLADTIEKEIGVNFSSHQLTLQAIVSGGAVSDFVQLLPIKMTKTFIKIGDSLTYTRGQEVGKFDYQVKLKENALFGAVTLIPPVAPPARPGRALGPGDTIFTRFIDSMTVSYSCKLSADKSVSQAINEVKIEAIAENPEKWSKGYTLAAATEQSGNLSLTFPLDLKQFGALFDTTQQETGVPASTQNLTLKATVHTLAQTGSGTIDKTFTQSIKTDLRAGILTWSGDMKKSEPGTIIAQQVVTEQAHFLGLPVLWVRIISFAIGLIALCSLLWYYLLNLRANSNKAVRADIQTRQISQKYKDLIVEIRELPETRPGDTVLLLDSFAELIKVAQGLLKPIIHKAGSDKDIYWVLDGATRYEYRTGVLLSKENPPGKVAGDNT